MAGSTTSSSSRKRGRDVEDERAKPLSLDKVLRCKWCKRRSDDDNPTPKKHVGPYLKFTHKVSAECLNCRNYKNSCCKGTDMAEMLRHINSGSEAQDDYNQCLFAWEIVFNDTVGWVASKDGRLPTPQCVKLLQETGVESREVLGVFWPQEVYEREEPNPYDKKLEQIYVHKGKRLRGVWREASAGMPRGVIQVSNIDTTKATRTRDLASTAQGASSSQIKATFGAAQGEVASVAFLKRPSNDSDTVDLIEPAMKKRVLLKKNSDASSDWAMAARPKLGQKTVPVAVADTADSDADTGPVAARARKKPTSTPKKTGTRSTPMSKNPPAEVNVVSPDSTTRSAPRVPAHLHPLPATSKTHYGPSSPPPPPPRPPRLHSTTSYQHLSLAPSPHAPPPPPPPPSPPPSLLTHPTSPPPPPPPPPPHLPSSPHHNHHPHPPTHPPDPTRALCPTHLHRARRQHTHTHTHTRAHKPSLSFASEALGARGKRVYASQQQKVISACDELIRQGNAAVQSCATREGVASWSEKKLQALATKLQDKITSSDVIFTLTSENTVISDNGERTSLHLLGKEKLETMMSLASTVAMVWELAKALSLASDACGEHNTGATSLEASAAFVYACAAGLVQAGVTVAPTVYQQICKRQAFEYLERMELGRVASLLDVGCLDVGDPSEPFNVSVLLKPRMDAQQFGAFYGSLVCDVFVEVARAYDQEALAKFTYEMADSKVKHDADLAKDIFALHSLLNPESATLDHLTDALARPTSPTFKLAKALSFPVAAACVAEARKCLVRKLGDKAAAHEMSSLLLEMTAPVKILQRSDTMVSIMVAAKTARKLRMRLAALRSTTSAKFAFDNADALNAMDSWIDTSGKTLSSAQTQCFWTTMEGPLEFISLAMAGSLEATPDAFRAATVQMASKDVEQSLTSPAGLGFDAILTPETLAAREAATVTLRVTRDTLANLVKTLEFSSGKWALDAFSVEGKAAWAHLQALQLVGHMRAEASDVDVHGPFGSEATFASVRSRLVPLGKSFACVCSDMCYTIVEAQPWFIEFLTAVQKRKDTAKYKMDWPHNAPEIENVLAYTDRISFLVPLLASVEEWAVPSTALLRNVGGVQVLIYMEAFARLVGKRSRVKTVNVAKLDASKLVAAAADAREWVTAAEELLADVKDSDTGSRAPKLVTFLEMAVEEAKATVVSYLDRALELWEAAAKVCSSAAQVKELDTTGLVDADVLPEEALLALAHSPAAKTLKASWKQFATILEMPNDVADALKLPYRLDDTVIEQYVDPIKNKVCEMVALSALFKPLSAGQTRMAMKRESKNAIDSLGGILPPKLGLLFDAEPANAAE